MRLIPKITPYAFISPHTTLYPNISHTIPTTLSIKTNTCYLHHLIPFNVQLLSKLPTSNRENLFYAMATMTSAAVAIPSFTGLKAASSAKVSATAKVAAPAPRFGVKASLKDVGIAVAATAATAMLASNAMAIDVLLGSSDGGLVFEPSNFSISSGEKIVFKNNAGFPHNVVFDEDEIPGGVDASKISMSEEDLLNAPGETYSVTLTEKGSYSFYCSPHQGAGMVGKVTVN